MAGKTRRIIKRFQGRPYYRDGPDLLTPYGRKLIVEADTVLLLAHHEGELTILNGTVEVIFGDGELADLGKLATRLMERGLDEAMLKQIFWSNALGVMDRCSM